MNENVSWTIDVACEHGLVMDISPGRMALIVEHNPGSETRRVFGLTDYQGAKGLEDAIREWIEDVHAMTVR